MSQCIIRCSMITVVVAAMLLMSSPARSETVQSQVPPSSATQSPAPESQAARSQAIQSQGGKQWAPFEFLLGNWIGAGTGQPGEAVGRTSFSKELGGNILVRKNRVEFPPKPGEKSGIVHEDLLLVYQQPGDSTYRAIYFDNESHVINYVVSLPAKHPAAVFESEGSDKAPRFRLVYSLGPDGLLNVDFLIAPPGGEFRAYTTGKARRSEQK